MALGGGCEILLHSSAVQAHAESYIGLVECGVGVLPGWGGCKEMLTRWQTDPSLPKGPMPAPSKVFETVSTATVSKSAAEAKELHFLRPTDGITMNRDRLLADAKAKALALVDEEPWRRERLLVLAESARRILQPALSRWRLAGDGTQILPIIIGEEGPSLRAAEILREHGMDVRAIRPPTVSAGQCRLRLSLNIGCGEENLLRLSQVLQDAQSHVE